MQNFKCLLSAIGLGALMSSGYVVAETVVMEKNNTSFSIDGGNGAADDTVVYLWSSDSSNVNQQWQIVTINDTFVQFQKVDTDHCLDGGDGGARLQPITLQSCDSSDENQHWERIALSNGTTRIKKRGVSFSIDGNNGGENGQEIYLWDSQDSNENQQWQFTTISSTQTVVFEKNNTSFSLDGGDTAADGRQLYLWETDTSNVNQQWVETLVDGSYYQYQKIGTPYCIDGGDDAARYQAVVLYTCDEDDRNQHWQKIDTAGGTVRLKKRGESFSIDGGDGAANRQEVYLWNSQDSNENQQWRILTVNDSSGEDDSSLDPDLEPWENFDLAGWVIDTPAYASDGESERFGELDWDDISDESRQFFYTHTDGGMRFVTRLDGAKTSTNTAYVRSELREMLRRGDTSISTTGVNKNNWRLGYQPGDADDWGGTNGVLSATLRVNKVTTTGYGVHVGRTIIGQIHADNDEPARLYYRKEPDDTRGCIYVSHEIRDGDDVDFDIIGNEDCDDPSDGIELDELFSYQIINDGAEIEIIVFRGDLDGEEIGRTSFNMDSLDSGYDREDEWMYFKAGAYTQNNRGDDDDGDIITFYHLSNTHD